MRDFGRIRPTLLVLALALGACGASDDGGSGDHARGHGATTTTAAEEADVVDVDWLDKALDVDLGNGYRLAHCEGDAPVHCVTRNGEPAGLVELSSYPLASLEAVSEARARGDRAALEAHVDDFLQSFRSDRRLGCGPEYVVTAEPPRFVDAPDGLLVHYGFTGSDEAGAAPTERTIQWAGLRGDNLVLISVSAYDTTSCVESGSEGTLADLAGVESPLRRLVEGNDLPAEVGPSSGR